MKRTQITLAGTGFEKYTKTTRRAQFLAEMDRVVPWGELCARIEPVYPKTGNGRPPIGVARMLRLYFLQHWFNLSDPAVEEALYDSPTMRAFVGIDLGREPVPDETTVCKFRHLLEAHGLGPGALRRGHQAFARAGADDQHGDDCRRHDYRRAVVHEERHRNPRPRDASDEERPAVVFGMKGHFGVDSGSKLIHSVEVTPANIHDSQVLPWLLHGQERRVWGDSAYTGQAAVLSVCAPHARDFTQRKAPARSAEWATNRWKSRVRARVEHPIGVIKRVFGFTEVCYRGLAKNRHRLVVACALANLFMMRKHLLRLQEV